MGMASDISKQFTDELRHIATEPFISRDILMKSAEMVNEEFQSFKATTKGTARLYYVLPGAKCSDKNSNYKYYKELTKRKWESFDEFITYGYQIFWVVSFSNDQWNTKSTCTCPVYFKQYICKHLVAIALRDGIIECPQTANPQLIAPKRKQGRAKNATKALMRS